MKACLGSQDVWTFVEKIFKEPIDIEMLTSIQMEVMKKQTKERSTNTHNHSPMFKLFYFWDNGSHNRYQVRLENFVILKGNKAN